VLTRVHTYYNYYKLLLLVSYQGVRRSHKEILNVLHNVNIFIFSLAIVPVDFFKGQDIRQSFEQMQDIFIEKLTKHNADIVTISAKIKDYCEEYYEIPHCNLSATTAAELFAYMRKLPFHNFLYLEILIRVANVSSIKYLSELVKEYKSTFFGKKFFELFLGASVKVIKIDINQSTPTTGHCQSKVKLKQDVTIEQLNQFTIEYTQRILHLTSHIVVPRCITNECICIEYLIPSLLADHAYHSACMNTDLFSKLNISYVTVGRYRIKPAETPVRSMLLHLCISPYL